MTITAKIMSRHGGNGISGRINFQAIGTHDREGCALMQAEAGYHPAGYGGPWDVKTIETAYGTATEWNCSASSD